MEKHYYAYSMFTLTVVKNYNKKFVVTSIMSYSNCEVK